MALDGDCTTDASIIIPDGNTLDGLGYTITAEDPGVGQFVGGVVENGGSVAHVVNLKITTSALANVCKAGDDRLRGILFNGASGTILDNTIGEINKGASGCQEGNAIEARNPPFDGTHPATNSVTISRNTITNFQKTGVLVNGDVRANIHDNHIAGLGPVPGIAQNGVQIGFGATGNVQRNTIAGSWFTGANWTSAGVLVFQADDTMIQNNSLSGNQTGIAIEAWGGWFGGPFNADGNKVIKNVIVDSDFGVSVLAIAWDGVSTGNSATTNNKVTNNSITNGTGGIEGVFVGTFEIGILYNAMANNNKVIHNKISGYTDDIVIGGSGTKVHANVTEP
jgi:hypothetical protein